MSIYSFPNRGKWGNNKWRGNMSGHLMVELFMRLKPKLFVDCMMGSGTSIEVAKEMGIEAVGLDIHHGFNAVRDSILLRVGREADFVFSHPPYSQLIQYHTDPDDLSRCKDDEDFNQKMQLVLLNQRNATRSGGYYGMLIGDWRRNGQYSCYAAEAMARMPKDELASVIIKAQHNCLSDRKDYGRMEMPFITHEYLVMWKKKSVTMLSVLRDLAIDQNNRLQGTWRSIVRSALIESGGAAELKDLYALIAKCSQEKLSGNTNWEAKVRQTLQLSKEFTSSERGVWALAA